MLEVKCGTADKSHENKFFRYFASQVKDYFERIGIEGFLVGMPGCRVRDNLQMDALLITDSSLTIIDFKDYDGCDVYLPDDSDFERGQWTTNKDFYIKGGSSRNPYAQLMRQRGWLKEILDRFCRHKIGDFDANHISAMVCFTGKVAVSGSIPGWAKLKFFIADSECFLQQLYDIANVRSAGLLGSDFANSMFDRLFDAQPYECEIKPSVPFAQDSAIEQDPDESGVLCPAPEVRHATLPALRQKATEAIKGFFESDQDVLIISSIDPGELEQLAISAQEAAHVAHFDQAMILTSTMLAGDNLCAGLSRDGSIYSTIYDSASRTRDRDGIEHIPLAKLTTMQSLRDEDETTDSADRAGAAPAANEPERTVFIICESQLVTSNAWLDGAVVFGSGKLLTDTLEFLGINRENKGRNKLVFIGDDCLLGSSSLSCSSMHREAYPSDVKVSEHVIPIDEPSDSRSDFLFELASSIRAKDCSLLAADYRVGNPRIIEQSSERSVIEDVMANWRTHKMIAYTNEKANQLNLYMKRILLHNGERLAPEDVLVFGNQFVAVSCDPFSGIPTRTIRNGEFAKVSYVGTQAMKLEVPTSDSGESETLTCVPVRFYPEGCTEEFEAWLILEYLDSPKAELSAAQEIAIKVKMGEIEREARARTPFGPGNPWFERMLSEDDFVEVQNKGFRQATDQRLLTPQEREYQEEIRRNLYVPGSPFFMLRNLAKARYGWTLTAHKAQSFRWDTVTLSANAGMGRHSDGYFRFLYTSATRASSQINIVKWADISPFEDTVFDANPSNVRKKSKREILFRASSSGPLPQQIIAFIVDANLPEVRVDHVASSKWREAFTLSREGAETTVAFDYNKSLEVSAPRLERGDTTLFNEVADALSAGNQGGKQESPLVDVYHFIESISGGETSVTVEKSDPYKDEIKVENEAGAFRASVSFNAGKIVSRIDLQSGDAGAFDEFRRLLQASEDSSSR